MKSSGLDLNAMQVLLAVVRAGGFSAASRHMGVPANRLSRQIQQLEAELGVRLLHRTTRRLALTATGRALVDGAQPALARLESLWRNASSNADEPRGHLRVAAPAEFFSLLSVSHMGDFFKRFPAISIEMILSDEEIDLVARGVDVAFQAGPILDEHLVAQRLGTSRFILVASPKCLAENGPLVDLQDLRNYPCVAARSHEGLTEWPLSGPNGPCTIQVKAQLTVSALGGMMAAARAGLGAALVPEGMARPVLLSGELVQVLGEYSVESGGFYAVYPSSQKPSAALRALLDFAVGMAQTMAQDDALAHTTFRPELI